MKVNKDTKLSTPQIDEVHIHSYEEAVDIYKKGDKMRNIELHNLRAFIKHHPKATAAEYARDRRQQKKIVCLIEKAYEAELRRIDETIWI